MIANTICIYGQNYSIEFINNRNGLTQSCGHSITRQNEFMWFGTQDGLNRFDGTRIKAFKAKEYPALRSNYINSILSDVNNLLWIGTTEGLSLMDTENNKIYAVEPDLIKFVKKIYKDDYGNLWVTPQNKGLFLRESKSEKFENLLYFQKSNVRGFDEYNCKTYITTTKDVFLYNRDNQSFDKLIIHDNLKVLMGDISSFLIGKDGVFWIGTFKKGVFRFVENNGKLILEQHFNTVNSEIKSNEITCISEDETGNIWLGTRASSTFVYSGKNWVSLNDFNKSNNSIKGYIFSIYHDIQGITWIGTDGDGIAKCDPKKEKFTKILHLDKDKFDIDNGEIVFDLNGLGSKIYIGVKDKYILEYDERTNFFDEFVDHDKNYFKNHPRQILFEGNVIWIGSDKGLRQFKIKENKYTPLNIPKEVIFIYTICLVGENEIWTGGTEGLTRLNKSNLSVLEISADHPLFEISSFLIRNLHVDQFGKVWIGTIGHGLFLYDPLSNNLTKINSNFNLDCNGIRCFLEDDNVMFVGTDCGLYELDLRFNVTQKISAENGLPNDVVYAIEKSRKSGYWLSTNAGLTYASEGFTKFDNYNEDDGLPGNEFNTNCSFVSDSGFFYFGGMKGIVKFNENEIKNNNYLPLLRVNDIFIDNLVLATEKWKKDSTILVEPNEKYVKVVLSISNFSNSENNHCVYKLTGLNDWQRVPENNEILFTGLKSGKYQLSVKGFNNDGIQAKNMVHLLILVKAPFWQQWWFYMSLLVLVLFIVYLWIKKEWKAKEKEIKYKSEIEEIRNVALRSQMNPHFIFNCLSAIEYLMISDSPEKAQSYLNKFSRLVRNTLDFTNNELVSMKDELRHLDIYIQLENLRFNNRIEYKTNITNEINLESILFPPLILQPIVENSIKHGFTPEILKPEIYLEISKSETNLIIQLTDNGIGISKRNKNNKKHNDTSYGIEVTKQRLKIYSRKLNKVTDLQISDRNEENKQGTKVVITIEL